MCSSHSVESFYEQLPFSCQLNELSGSPFLAVSLRSFSGQTRGLCIEDDRRDQILVGMKDPSALKMERKKGTMTRQKENMEENEKIDHLKKEKSE